MDTDPTGQRLPCRRHRWDVVRERRTQINGPTGHPSGRWGTYQTLQCRHCGLANSRTVPDPPRRF